MMIITMKKSKCGARRLMYWEHVFACVAMDLLDTLVKA